MSIVKKFLFIIFVVGLTSAKVSGQAARSPFTTFGLGEPYGNSLIQSQGMAGVGVSQPQYWYINNQNPALLVYNMNTMFQAGMVGERRDLRGDTLQQRSINGNLNYLVTAFNVSRKPGRWTTSLGLMPYTTVNYEFESAIQTLDNNGAVVDTASVYESGDGGLNQFYWSNGVRLNKNFSVGLKAAYLFGPVQTTYSSRISSAEQTFPFVVIIEEKTNVKDFLFSLGGHYSKDSLGRKNKYRLSAGAVYEFGTKLKAKRRGEVTRTTPGGSVTNADTLFTRSGRIKLPGSLTLGVSLASGMKWSVGTEFTYQDWSQFESINQDDEGLGKSWKMAIGGEITPDALAFENYLKRITYRLGLSYERTPFIVDNAEEGGSPILNPVNDFGINFGFSLPAGRSSLDFAFKAGKRGNRQDNIFEENYFKVYVGLTFNDQWFIKRKFD